MREADTGLSARLRRRWDHEADLGAGETFDDAAIQINLRRIELAVLVSLANSAIQIYLGVTSVMTPDSWLAVASLPLLIGFAVAARVFRSSGRTGVLRALPVGLAVFSLGLAQTAVSVIAADGRLTAGYPLVVLAVALIFVFPPRVLVIVLGGGLLAYGVMVARMPVTTWEKAVAGLTALICTAIAIASGLLIEATRRRDHEQKRVIRRQNERLAVRDREMDELMAVTAHDLRSPLLGLRNLMTLAAARAASDPAVLVQVIGEARLSVDAMLSLVGGLIEGHQAEHGGVRPVATVDLSRLAAEALARIEPVARAAGVTVALRAPKAAVHGVANSPALLQVLQNLLANAIQASRPGDAVMLICEQRQARAVLAVQDRGAGVAPDERPHIFEKFWRGAHAARSNPGGAGLGLFIVRTLCQRMGAEIRHQPARPTGARFEILFAAPPGDAPATPPHLSN